MLDTRRWVMKPVKWSSRSEMTLSGVSSQVQPPTAVFTFEFRRSLSTVRRSASEPLMVVHGSHLLLVRRLTNHVRLSSSQRRRTATQRGQWLSVRRSSCAAWPPLLNRWKATCQRCGWHGIAGDDGPPADENWCQCWCWRRRHRDTETRFLAEIVSQSCSTGRSWRNGWRKQANCW